MNATQLFPDAHFGQVEEFDQHAPLPDVEGMDDDDDEELEVTPPDVIAMLGVDPLEFDDDDDEDDEDDDDGDDEELQATPPDVIAMLSEEDPTCC